eukprot:UC4_evm2s399
MANDWAIVIPTSFAQQARALLESSNHYDLTRAIRPWIASDQAPQALLMPITDVAAAELMERRYPSTSLTNSKFGDVININAVLTNCTTSDDPLDFALALLRTDLPRSKTSHAKAHSPHVILRKNIKELLLENFGDVLSISDINLMLDSPGGLPSRWERHGDLVLLGESSFSTPEWVDCGPALLDAIWPVVASSLQASKVAIKARIDPGPKRESQVQLLYGDDGWVEHTDNGIKYRYDVTKCMFSAGNITEKLRVASMKDARGQTVVDMYAGIGYFTLPYLIHAGAAKIYACEWNLHAVKALKINLEANGISPERYTVLHGDNREVCPQGIADRVNLGLIPTSRAGWETACYALKPSKGGWLHIHENVNVGKGKKELRDLKLAEWSEEASGEVKNYLCKCHGGSWNVKVHHIETVKSYAPVRFSYSLKCSRVIKQKDFLNSRSRAYRKSMWQFISYCNTNTILADFKKTLTLTSKRLLICQNEQY